MVIDRFLTEVGEWAKKQPDITGVLLVGSHARGQARQDSDVDLVILSQVPRHYLEEVSFVEQFGHPLRLEEEDWGALTSLRVWYEEGLEVEFGLTRPEWAALPPDPGTREVVADGALILFDREGKLDRLLQCVPPAR